MKEKPNPDQPILVTGASGYIASWVVKKLLERGLKVRGTVRDKNKPEKVKHLLKMGQEEPGELELFEADLMQKGSFEEAMKGCEVVIHMASPFFLNVKDVQEQLIEPALEGTRNVLESVNNNPTVKRVVQTSSCAAIYGDNQDVLRVPNKTFTEDQWNVTSSPKHQAYSFSKTVAEREAWKMVNEQSRWDLVVINPGFVMGPSLTDRTDSTSIDFMRSMANGKLRMGAPELYFGMVDVREVAEAHVQAALNPDASGRHILVADTIPALEIAKMLERKYDRKYPFPKKNLPKFMLYLFGPTQGFSWKYIRNNIGIPMKFDNSYSIQDLNIKYRPLEETVQDHMEQLIESGIIAKK